MATPFSSPDDAIINTIVPLSQLTLTSTSKAQGVDVETLYDVRYVAKQIQKHNFRRVALQFPDELLCDASAVFWSLKDILRQDSSSSDDYRSSSPPELYILADTSYGNCCVDEVAAEHVDADVVIHFGHACLSPTSRLPTVYVFHRLPIEVERCTSAFESALQEQVEDETDEHEVVLTYDVGYEHACERIYHELECRTGRTIHLSKMDKMINWTRFVERNDAPTNEDDRNGKPNELTSTRKNVLPPHLSASNALVLYVGPESLALTNLLLRLGPAAKVIRYDADSNEIRSESGRTNKLLQRRYVAVQKARDAQTVGLLVGTLGLRSYLPLLHHLRTHLTSVQGKRVYTISVGKLNPAKLANFQEIDVFVLIACPENSLVDSAAGAVAHDPRDFFRPIVTPFELLTAFKGREWTGEYELDLEHVYAEAKALQGPDASVTDEDETPHFSLVTGGLVSKHRSDRRREDEKTERLADGENALSTTDSALHQPGVVTIRRADGTLSRVMESAGAAHLATRSWRGLEQRINMDEPAPLEKGRSGIAKGYTAGREGRKEGQGRE